MLASACGYESEFESKCQLDLPWCAHPDGGCVNRLGYDAKLPGSRRNIRVGRSELGAIEKVERFRSELELIAFFQGDPFARADISLPQTWGAGYISRRIAEGACGRNRKCRWVDPLCRRGATCRSERNSRQDVRALVVRVAIGHSGG